MAKSVERVDGVLGCEINFATGLMLLESQVDVDLFAEVESVVRASGHGVTRLHAEEGPAEMPTWWQEHRQSVMTLVAGALLGIGWLLVTLGAEGAAVVSWAASVAAAGVLPGRRAWLAIRSRSVDMNVLMTTAVVGAMVIGEWSEAATVLTLFSVGNWLESRSLVRTRRSIRELMSLTPAVALLRRGDRTVGVAPEDVAIGDVIVVRPGERVPLDGAIVSGSTALDESPITGESVPVDKTVGDAVFTGTLNTYGLFELQVTATVDDSTLSRVIRLVEEAQGKRAPLERLVDRFTAWYTPAVIVLAATVAVVPPLLAMLLGTEWGSLGEWFYRGLVLLVVGCPCALVISTPVAIVSAITRATRDGVLVKGGAFLELARRVDAVVLDKTGTLTTGRPEVADIVAFGEGGAEEVLEIAATLEAGSTHPLAQAVTRAAGGVPSRHLDAFAEVPGRGVRAESAGARYLVGSPGFVEEHVGPLQDAVQSEIERMENDGRTVLAVAVAERVVGVVGVSDAVRHDARRMVKMLGDAGVQTTVMLTGDNDRTASAVARGLGIDEFKARQMPADKMETVRVLQDGGAVVAMLGDGINDAAALALADIGIAMGAAGSDTALEVADVALLGEDLTALPRFLDLGRRTVANIYQNVAFSIGFKVLVLILAALGRATLWMAVMADTGVSLLVVANGLRLLRKKDI